MRVIRSAKFTADNAWGAMNIANMNGITTKLHWTDKPYKWHINEGEEVFVVLNGMVEMHFREADAEKSVMLQAGDIFYASEGAEHVAKPLGEARVLVIETDGSV
ncbi:3-hydroxyanthranilate 3,4-dioxygenase [Grimontia celer]|uniref:3-hydroxyanthranilate 3,4-dioxygenase n=1 Tax=Grimontia celer TaxID=1796497 RepID=A0A128F323_9GAMM|nr:cupin domain-containing protein [Grimontia celer]CZF80646.1 3-hydroxyanthranilate 3,4-dioxygenase [Grimontia celer]